MAKAKETNTDEVFVDDFLIPVNQGLIVPAMAGNLDNGLLGDEIKPGIRKIIVGCPLGSGSINWVIVGDKHWQKVCNADRTLGYWMDVSKEVKELQAQRQAEAAEVKK